LGAVTPPGRVRGPDDGGGHGQVVADEKTPVPGAVRDRDLEAGAWSGLRSRWMNWDPAEEEIEEKLVEFAYLWGDVEEELAKTYPGLAERARRAFRVEAFYGRNGWDDPCVWYRILFDVTDSRAREAARALENNSTILRDVITKIARPWHTHDYLFINAVVPTTPVVGQVCRRTGEQHPKGKTPTLDDVPTTSGFSTDGLEQRDGYWLTPIEAPFYEALKETGLTFSVQPWIEGPNGKYRLDFLVFYDGAAVGVELDGHEWHKTREQRSRDASRDRWFQARKIQIVRFTGSQVNANVQGCVSELLNVVRASQARP
jgi:very-short-patch-repair endonuclease